MNPSSSPQFTAAIVTGASRGLGFSIAEGLARVGTRVLLVARSSDDVTAAVARILAAHPGILADHVHGFAGDIADKHQTHAIAAAAEALGGPVDLLVHNASTLGPLPLRPLWDLACEDLAAVLEVNLIGPFRLTKVVAGAMALRGRGTVLHISSDAATSAYPGWGAYGVSKAAQDHLVRSFAADFAASGFPPDRVPRFYAVDPGEMDTKMHADAVPDADRATLTHPDAVAERILRWLATNPSTGARATELS